ncbi:MAG: hypothetical protein HYY95_25340 [Candidatus Rokubacteria bacterium]|nr:hypothetical protein [Candidatus Rokubacteria bacterium]MBI3108856.1 hypothetical protein [Candidatus Rokubacteria bacterium]
MAVLSRVALNLADCPDANALELQRTTAPAFFDLETRQRVDKWIQDHPEDPDVYLFSQQQLLHAMTLSLLSSRLRAPSALREPPFTQFGRALLHITGLLDPLAADPTTLQGRSPAEQSRAFVPFILRNGIFYDHEEYRYVIPRYLELLWHLPEQLAGSPQFVDIRRVFKTSTGLRLDTYLRFGAALLASVHMIAADRQGPSLLNLRTLRPPTHLRRSWRRFMTTLMTCVSRYRRLHRALQSRSSLRHYNFLAAERYPLVRIGKRTAACLSLQLLERKFGPGLVHAIGDGLCSPESKRFRDFLGQLFEKYVTDLLSRAFPGLFVHSIRYGNNLEAGDGWLPYPPSAVLFEVKSSYLLLDTRLSGDLAGFDQYFTSTILKAASQLDRAINDFRAGRFAVGGLCVDAIQRVYPVLVTLHYLPMEKFVGDLIEQELRARNLLQQPDVHPLTILPVKDLEKVEALGGGLLELVRDRLNDDAWSHAPFSNFIFHRHAGQPGGFPNNGFLVGRYHELLAGAARQLFNVDLRRS